MDSLTGSEISDIIESRDASYTVHAEIPKFSSETDMELPDVLKEMGITDAFSDRADFSRMYDTESNPGVQISEVIHKTFIEVNEQETKAAAATAVGIMETSTTQRNIYLSTVLSSICWWTVTKIFLCSSVPCTRRKSESDRQKQLDF